MHSTEDLRATLDERIEAFARTGHSDRRVLEDAETRDLSFDGVPLVLLGMGSKNAQPFVKRCLERADVRALIDNGIRGTHLGSLTVAGDEAYAAATAIQGSIDVICCGGAAGVAHFEGLAERAGRKHLNLYQAMRRLDGAATFRGDDRIEYGDSARYARMAEGRDLAPIFADELSRRTYYAVLLYQLSWSMRWLQQIRQPIEEIYFKSGLFDVGHDEHFVDGGAFSGDSIRDFLAATGGAFGTIESFEPDPVNFDLLAAAHAGSERIRLHKAGLWSSTGRIGFTHDGTSGSAVSEDRAETIDVIALDDLDLSPTLIKLDVEGSEPAVLEGARRTIIRHRPRLAVCVYHRPSHMWDVAAFLEGLDLGYRFGLRHYTDSVYDTVLYAY